MTNVDCIADSFEPEVSEGNKRNLTVGYASRYPDYQRIPSVVMKGQWLEAAGFETGTKVEVRVMKGWIRRWKAPFLLGDNVDIANLI